MKASHDIPSKLVCKPIVINLLCAMALVIILTACRQESTSVMARGAYQLVAEGGQDRWGESRKILENCIKRGETDPHVISLYVLSLYRTGAWTKAQEIAEEQVAANPQDFYCNYLLGKIHYEEGRYHTALEYLSRCRNLRPDHLDTLILMANCASMINPSLAVSLYTKLVENPAFNADYLSYNNLAVNYVHKGDSQKALSAFSKAVLLSEEHPLVILNMAIVNDQYTGNESIARRYYMRFLALSKEHHRAKRLQVQQILKRIKA